MSVHHRAAALVAEMDLQSQAGLLFHPMVFLGEDLDVDAASPLGPSLRELIEHRGIRTLCVGGIPSPQATAAVTAELQEFARSRGSRAPLILSTDPRHSFMQNAGASHRADGVSQWPEPIGFGALDDEDAVRTFADIVRQDYLAMGIRMALHPQVDLATEPRWARQAQSFGATPAQTSRLLKAYLEGLQGRDLSGSSVAATTKHFPGGGPQLDGEDPHFPYGREQVWPGGRFDDHLAPFVAAIEAGTAAMMPYYGMPVGLQRGGSAIEEVGFAFNRQIITELLRTELGFDGLVLSDFGLITDANVFGKPFPARAWGVEQLSRADRMLRLLDAGIDQFGGESDVELLVDLVESDRVDRSRIAASAIRVVELQLRLGLWDDPVVADTQAGFREHIELGVTTQARAMVLLRDDRGTLPLANRLNVVAVGVDESALPDGWVHTTLDEADMAIVRLSAPREHRDTYFLEAAMEQGSLEFPEEVIVQVRELAASVPVMVIVTLTRPAIVTPLIDLATVMLGDFGASDAAVISVLTGAVQPEGRLPFELPRSMKAVVNSKPDVAADTVDPVFRAGWSALDTVEASVSTSGGAR